MIVKLQELFQFKVKYLLFSTLTVFFSYFNIWNSLEN